MFNPAFLAATIRTFLGGYEEEADAPAPFELMFIGLPLVLHPSTRKSLPSVITSSFLTWVSQHPLERARFPHLARSLVSHVREGCLFAIGSGLVQVDGLGALRPTTLAKSQYRPSWPSEEIDEIQRKARFVGRWFARTGSVPTILATLGVKP